MNPSETKCSVLDCKTMIKPGDVYYLLAEKIPTCEQCACFTTYTIIVNKKKVIMTRGWQNTSVNNELRRIM